jgi:hypothetical protein
MSNPSTAFARRRVCVLLGGPIQLAPPPVPPVPVLLRPKPVQSA